MASKWWRCSITFMGVGRDRDDAIARMRGVFGDLPLKDLHFSATPMAEGEVVRALDRESAKKSIEDDSDTGVRLTDLPIMPQGAVDEGFKLVGGMVPQPDIVHPWAEGFNIFPPDHPLAPYEALARQQHDQQAIEQMELMKGEQLQLPRGEENE